MPRTRLTPTLLCSPADLEGDLSAPPLSAPALSAPALSALQALIAASALAALTAAGEARAQTSLTTPNNTIYVSQDRGGGQLTGPSEWGGWPRLCVRAACVGDACPPCGANDLYEVAGQLSALELSGRQRRMAPQSLHNVEVTRRVFVPESGGALADSFVRFVDSLRNTSGAPITVSVRLGTVTPGVERVGRAGSQVWRTSSYDADVSAADRWVLIDDADATGGDNAVAVIAYGAGGIAPDRLRYGAEAGDAQGLSWDFDAVTIPPNSTVSLITLALTEPRRVDVLSEVTALLRFNPVDATFGLSDAERDALLNVDLNPFNAAPLADLSGPYNAVEGSPLQVSGATSFDLEGFPLSYAWDFDGDGVFGEVGAEAGGANTQVSFAQNGEYPIALRVTDHQGKQDTDRVVVRVRNADPTISSVLTSAPITEGGRLQVQVTASDLGPLDVLSYAFDWEGQGAYEPAPPTTSRLYSSDGPRLLGVRVSDADGGVAYLSVPVEVLNAAPTIQQVVANHPSVEGASVTFSVSAVDAGGDPLTYCFDFNGDGVTDVTSALPSVTRRFEENGTYAVGVRVSDDLCADPTRTSATTFTLSVLNATPVISGVEVGAPAREGSPVSVRVVASDAGDLDRLTYELDLDGLPGFELSQPSPTFTHTFPDNLRRDVTARVTDDDGAAVTYRFPVEVLNVPPTATLSFAGATVREGVVVTVDQGTPFEGVVTASDASAVDAASLTYFWDLNGDGVYEQIAASARLPMSFASEGSYRVRCLVRDKDLGEVVVEREVVVSGRPPVTVGAGLELLDAPPFVEGRPLRFVARAQDPDPMTYSFDFDGDGTFEVSGASAEVRHTFSNNGVYDVRARATDTSGYAEATLRVVVENAAPSVEIDTGAAVGEGDPLSVTITARDPGAADVVTLTVTLQDTEEIIDLAPGASRRFSIPTQDNGLVRVTASAVDSDGARGGEVTALALVQNRAPFVPTFTPRAAVEGSRYSQVIPADDPAGLNDTLTFSLIDPPQGVEIEAASGLLLWAPTYADYLSGTVTFQVVIEDEDGGRLEYDLAVPVLPRDEDQDGIPDTYEQMTCERFSPCLNPAEPADATLDADADGRGALEEWRDGSDPFTYEGPAVPTLAWPTAGEVVQERAPALTVDFVASDRPLPLVNGELVAREVSLAFEVYADEGLTTLVAESGWVPQGAAIAGEVSSWRVPADALREDARYWWRARSQDGPAQSRWSAVEPFRVNAENAPPPAPTLALPLDQSVVDRFLPTLTFYPSADPDGDEVYFVVRLYREGALGPVPDGGGQVTPPAGAPLSDPLAFEPSNRLQENGRYLWDVVAVDEAGLESPPSDQWRFAVDLENEAPSAPIIYAPAPDGRVSTLTPLFQAGGSVDQEGAPLSYHFEVRLYGEELLIDATDPAGVPTRGALAEWTPEASLREDKQHVVSVFSSDGRAQSPVVTQRFFVSAVDNAPSVPNLLEPDDGATLPPNRAVLVWSEAVDPEGGRVRYKVQYCDQRGACEESEALSERRFDISEAIPPQEVYLWRVSAFDDAGHTLGPSGVRRVSLTGGAASSSADSGCAHSASPHPQGALPVTLLALLALCGAPSARRRSPSPQREARLE
jgi:PKD repeat protein